MENIGYASYGGLNQPSMLGMTNRDGNDQKGFFSGRFGPGGDYESERSDEASHFARPDIPD